MKTKIIFLVIITALCVWQVNSQITLSATRALLSENDKAILDSSLSEYTVFTIDRRELMNNFHQTGKCQFRISIDYELDWTLDLELNDMRAPDFRQTYTTAEGEFEYTEPFIVNTFKGKTSTGQIARFTIDENTFSGIILDDKFHYAIRPIKDYTRNLSDENLIVYRSSDIVLNNDNFDYINDTMEFFANNIEDDELESMEKSSTAFISCWYLLKMATDADYEFYDKTKGSGSGDIKNTYNRIFSILNEAEAVYESTFYMTFLITFQHVYTTNTNPDYTELTDIDKLFTQFKNYWNTNRPTVPDRNIAHLFSGKNLNYLGVADIGHVSDNLSYSISKIYMDYQYLTIAHEIGHNLNAIHVSSADCACSSIFGYSIMCSQPPSNQLPSSLWFCNSSITIIQTFINSKITILSSTLLIYRILSGSLTDFNSYKAYYRIESTQVINSGYTSYRSGDHIILKDGFQAKSGSIFIAKIEEPCSGTYNPAPPPPLSLVRPPGNFGNDTDSNTGDNDLTPIEKIQAVSNISEIEVFPNPANDKITVKSNTGEHLKQIEINNSLGINVLSTNTENVYSSEINISRLASGVYFVRVITENNTIRTAKIIKK